VQEWPEDLARAGKQMSRPNPDPGKGTREPGVSFFGIVEPVGAPCEGCGARPGSPQVCPGDKRMHRHGMIHTLDGRLAWLCDGCCESEASKWGRRR
jgi:hypothetical protein